MRVKHEKKREIRGNFWELFEKKPILRDFFNDKTKKKKSHKRLYRAISETLELEAPPRFELGDQSFAVTFRGAIIVDIEPFLGV